MATDISTLLIDQGADKGQVISIPQQGVRIGRSSKSDVVIRDPKLSRHHCRMFHKEGIGLFVADLGSANETLVNDVPVKECQIHESDRIQLGDTVLRVTQVSKSAVPSPVDLGLSREQGQPSSRNLMRKLLVATVVMVILAACVIWFPRLIPERASDAIPITETVAPVESTIEIHYEKIIADAEKIFRYEFTLNSNRKLTVQIDDTGSVHINESSVIKKALIQDLAARIRESGFFAMDESYEGIAKPNKYESWTISITIDRRTHEVHVVNRLEPPHFRTLRQKLEDFGQIELGLWAVEYPPEKLVEMATHAYMEGQKLFDARDVTHGNLSDAIKNFKMAKFYLQTLDPKPDFYVTIVEEQLPECEEELDRRYVQRNFLATRASSLREWNDAADHLRVVLELIPNREDPRNVEARKLLLEVEDRLRSER